MFSTIVELNARHEIGESLGRCHSKMLINDGDVGVVETGHEEREIKSTCSYDVSNGFQARCHVVTFPSGYHGLCLVKTDAKFDLGETGSQSSFFNEVSTYHTRMIVHICYITDFLCPSPI